MVIVFCNNQVQTKLRYQNSNSFKLNEEIDYISSVDELNLKLFSNNSKDINLIIFSDILYSIFSSNVQQANSYLSVIRSTCKFSLTYVSENPQTDEIARNLANTGVKSILKYPENGVALEFISECIAAKADMSIMENLIDLKQSDVGTTVEMFKFLVDKVYSALNSPSLPSILTENQLRFIEVENRLSKFATDVQSIEKMLSIKDAQLRAYSSRIESINTQLDEINKMKDKLIDELEKRNNEIGYLALQNSQIEEHQKNIIEKMQGNNALTYYTTKDADALHSDLKAIIIFKEYNYSRYFNTFIKYLYNVLSSKGKDREAYSVRVAIFYNNLDNSGVPKFSEFSNCDAEEYVKYIPNTDKLITSEVNADFMISLVQPTEGDNKKYDILIVIDRRKDFLIDMYKGIKVARFSVADSNSDVRAYSLDKSTLVSSGVKDAGVYLPQESVFSLPNKSVRAEETMYKKNAITGFLSKLSEIYNIQL